MRFDRSIITAPIGRPAQVLGGGVSRQKTPAPISRPSDLEFGKLQERLDLLENREIPTFDPTALQQGIAGLQDQFSTLPKFDDSALRDRLKVLEGREIPVFDPSELKTGIAGLEERLQNLPQFDPSQLQDRLKTLESRELPKFNPQDFRDDFLNIAREGINIPEYTTPDLSGFARLEDLPQIDTSKFLTASDIPSFDREAFRQEILNELPTAPVFDREALIKDIRGGIDIPKPPIFDRQKLIEDIRGGLDIPQAPVFDRDKLIEDIRGGINIPKPPSIDRDALITDIQKNLKVPEPLQPFDPSGLQSRLDDLEKRFADFRPGSQEITPVDPIVGQPGQRKTIGTPVVEPTPIKVPEPLPPRPPSIGGIGGINQDPRPFEKPIMPPRRDDFMSIDRLPDPRTNMNIETRDTDFGQVTTSSPAFGSPSSMRQRNADFQLGPLGNIPVSLGQAGINPEAGSPVTTLLQPATATDPVQPAPTEPAAVAPTAGADPTQTQMPVGAIDPVLLQQASSETITDPLIRSLYFGTADQPGFYQQLQQAGANLIGQDVPLQQTAGLTPLELLARQQAVAGIGGFEPFLQQNRDLVNQAIAQSRRAEELQDPYYTQAEEIYKDTMGAYDPSMTQQFYNPFEDAVVQQTIDDVLEAGDKQDIASRAREISSGAFGGSRARLGAEERREALGEGLAQALGRIRQQGYSEAQSTGLGEFARQQAAKRTGAQGLMGIGVGRGSAASQLGQQLAGYGSQIGGIGSTQEGLRAGQRGELAGFGGIGRGIAETGLGRIYEQQIGQQYRPMQTLGQIAGMLPGYQASATKIDSQYGMPTDPSAAGLGAAFSAYGALAPRQGSS